MATRPRRRVPAEDTREQLLEAGLDRLEAEGLAATLESVSLEQMVRYADVPRSSAYASWQAVADDDQTPQVAFQRELLRRAIVGAGVGARNSEPMARAAAEVLERRHELAPEDLAAEMIRRAIEAQFLDAAQRRGYRTGQALTAVAASVPDDEVDAELIGWLREAESMYVDELSAAFRQFADVTSMKPAPDLDGPNFWRQFTTAVLALGEGLFPRLRTSDSAILFGLNGPGPGGQAEWTLYAVGMHAFFQRFFVPA